MKHVYTGRDAMDANFLKGLLTQEGIKAVVQGEDLQETWGGLPLGDENMPTVWVEDDEIAKAKPIVDRYRETDKANANEEGGDTARARWKCAQCGEMIETQFDRCWHCGHSRPAGTTVV